ncbi:unnamed protein product, partial [Mesorhabditis spiculigera]
MPSIFYTLLLLLAIAVTVVESRDCYGKSCSCGRKVQFKMRWVFYIAFLALTSAAFLEECRKLPCKPHWYCGKDYLCRPRRRIEKNVHCNRKLDYQECMDGLFCCEQIGRSPRGYCRPIGTNRNQTTDCDPASWGR